MILPAGRGRKRFSHFIGLLLSAVLPAAAAGGGEPALEGVFRDPPAAARPWTYWFWMNGNISREGITADLEAMARVGIGGVLIMEVARPGAMAPEGPVAFAGPEWREMFKHVVSEARRLGLQVCMNNDAGWCGSGGPWIPPELSMQALTAATLDVDGPRRFEGELPRPKAKEGYYRDVRVLAWPASGTEAGVPREAVLDLSAGLDAAGRLAWDAPAGRWRVARIGCTTTGAVNKPAPRSGLGLECDKLDPEGVRRHFAGLLARLADDAGPESGRTFAMTHIDSWEVGGQDWTARMPEEFRRRRGYDLTSWLAVLAVGATVGGPAETARFRRDYRRTCSELLDEAYAGALRRLAARRGLTLSIEAYGNPGFLDPLTFGAEADLPMAEFWIARWGAWHLLSPRLMASVAHVHGKPVVGAESFTAMPDGDAFTEHPYSVKTTGDWAFCEGVNRFVFHRTALNPWPDRAPGMGFAGYGWHVDRQQTWWEPGAAYFRYLARCQAVLQQGRLVADVARLVTDGESRGQRPDLAALPDRYDPLPAGYNYDYLSDRALDLVTVREGRLVTPAGASWSLLQLPNSPELTPEAARKIRDLVRAGAIVAGPAPERSPSLQDYPDCDRQVRELAAETWSGAGNAGRAIPCRAVAEELDRSAGGPDFTFAIDPPVTDDAIQSVTRGRGIPLKNEPSRLMPTTGLNWIHRRTDRADVYFVANPQHREVEALCDFRVRGLPPAVWDPATGEIRRPAVYRETPRGVQLPIHFDPAGSVFVVFAPGAPSPVPIAGVTRGDESLFGADRRAPARLPELRFEGDRVVLEGGTPGRYGLVRADGSRRDVEVGPPPAVLPVAGPWTVRFPPGRGAPEQAAFPELTDWSKHADPGVRYFSGTATYATEFAWTPPSGDDVRWRLDLGRVDVIAEVRLNGRDLGALWKPPFAAEATTALRPGRNELEVKVTNLWPNRLIGDEQFPDDGTPDGKWTTGPIPSWPDWLTAGRPRPEPRRVTFTTWKYYTRNSPLLPSGLQGPVVLRAETRRIVE